MDDECLNVDLLHFALNEFLSDLILLNGNKEYRYNSFNISSCHKVVICACSDYFYKKFKQDEDLGKVNNQVKLTIPERMETYGENFDDIALPLLIKFCYSKENFNLIQKEINPSNVFSFISIAHCLGMKSFLYHLENFISDTMINVNHCACLLKESYKFGLKKVFGNARTMILENFFQSSLSSKEVILSFPFDLFLNLVLLDEVETESEKNLCDLIFNYIQFREDKEVVEIAMKDEDVVSGVEKEWTNTLNNIKSKFTIKALNTQEKRSLIEAIRFSHMSHVEIIEASKNPVMIQHQDLILEALSARLENYENILDDNKLLKLNLKPRKYTRTLLLTSTENKVEIKLSSTISTKEDKKNPLQLTENFNSIIDYPIPPQNESHNPIILNGNDWIELRYKYDYDTCGLFYYLGTLGNRTAYKNPHEIGQVIACASSIGKGKLSDIVGRDLINFRTLNEENAFVGVDLGDGRSFIPTSYSIRNRNSPQHVMVSWSLEGSNDRINFEVLDRRCFCYEDKDLQKKYEKMRNALTVPGRITTWGVDPNVRYKHPYGFRYIYLRQIERNSSGSYNLAISGIELYGYYRGII